MKNLLFLAVLMVAQANYAQSLKASDPQSKVSFSIKNFGIRTEGSLMGLQGSMELDPASAAPRAIQLSVDAQTINTDNRMRDNHLRKAEYFDVARYPRLLFTANSFTKTAEGYLVKGSLRIKGIEKNIEINCTTVRESNGYLFKGSFPINRRDFKVGGGSISLADELTVLFQIRFIQ